VTAVRVRVGPPYRLDRTLACGQCFRWTVAVGGAGDGAGPAVVARGVVDGALVRVTQDAAGLVVRWEGAPAAVRGAAGGPAASGGPFLARLVRHLGADAPLAEIEATLARDRVLRRLLPRTSGIALMRQDPWECLVSYVISAFNNIPKIVMAVERLSQRFGEPLPGGAARFPTPDRLADARPEALRACVLGYRAPYVRDLARLVVRGEIDLHGLGVLPYEDARQRLLALPGVGEKVAECVLLFAYGIGAAFPVDTWVQRAVEHWYFGGRARTPRAIRAWARDRFGPLAGYAQQHLYAAARAARVR
jgi:N-glycosylase/DNA lyase